MAPETPEPEARDPAASRANRRRRTRDAGPAKSRFALDNDSYGVRRFGDDRGYVTNGDRHDHRVVPALASRPSFSTYCSATRNCTTPDTRPVSRPPRPPRECPQPWPPDDRDGGGRPVPLSYCCLVPLPGRRTVRSRPRWSRRIRTRIAHGIVTATRECSWNPLATGPSSEVNGFRTELHASASSGNGSATNLPWESRQPRVERGDVLLWKFVIWGRRAEPSKKKRLKLREKDPDRPAAGNREPLRRGLPERRDRGPLRRVAEVDVGAADQVPRVIDVGSVHQVLEAPHPAFWLALSRPW